MHLKQKLRQRRGKGRKTTTKYSLFAIYTHTDCNGGKEKCDVAFAIEFQLSCFILFIGLLQ